MNMNLSLILLPFFVDDPVEVEADEQIVAEKMTGGTCTVHLHLHLQILGPFDTADNLTPT